MPKHEPTNLELALEEVMKALFHGTIHSIIVRMTDDDGKTVVYEGGCPECLEELQAIEMESFGQDKTKMN